MANLVVVKGPHPGRQFFLPATLTVIGRQLDTGICLDSPAVSRHHARIVCQDDRYFIEDLQSSNGTFVNGKRVRERLQLKEEDNVQIGPYVFSFRLAQIPARAEDNIIIREQVRRPPRPPVAARKRRQTKVASCLGNRPTPGTDPGR